jgi:hypothetical protein
MIRREKLMLERSLKKDRIGISNSRTAKAIATGKLAGI